MVAVRHVLPWRVCFVSPLVAVSKLSNNAIFVGDVSLSAEDKPPDYLIYRPPVVTTASPLDHNLSPTDSEDDHGHDLIEEHHHIEDDHHAWLGGMTALKYLAAGGAAGAGQPPHASRHHSSR